MSVRIYLTGRVIVEVDGEVLVTETLFRGKQGRLVFAYLVCERTRPVPKEEMATVIWPYEMSPAWEAALSALTSRLGALLSLAPLKELGVSFTRNRGQYQVRLPAGVWVDMEAGVSALDRAEASLKAGDTKQVLGPATVALAIAKRPFLPGVDSFWADAQREKLQRQLIRALDCLSESQIQMGEPGLAVETATQAVKLDTLRERGYRLQMDAYSASGNQAKAVNVYHQLRLLLAEELGTQPTPETEAVYLALLG